METTESLRMQVFLDHVQQFREMLLSINATSFDAPLSPQVYTRAFEWACYIEDTVLELDDDQLERFERLLKDNSVNFGPSKLTLNLDMLECSRHLLLRTVLFQPTFLSPEVLSCLISDYHKLLEVDEDATPADILQRTRTEICKDLCSRICPKVRIAHLIRFTDDYFQSEEKQNIYPFTQNTIAKRAYSRLLFKQYSDVVFKTPQHRQALENQLIQCASRSIDCLEMVCTCALNFLDSTMFGSKHHERLVKPDSISSQILELVLVNVDFVRLFEMDVWLLTELSQYYSGFFENYLTHITTNITTAMLALQTGVEPNNAHDVLTGCISKLKSLSNRSIRLRVSTAVAVSAFAPAQRSKFESQLILQYFGDFFSA